MLGLLADALAFVHRKSIKKNNERTPRERDGQRTHGRRGTKYLTSPGVFAGHFVLVTALLSGTRQALYGARVTYTEKQRTCVMKT